MVKTKKLMINGRELRDALVNTGLKYPIHLSAVDKKTGYCFDIADKDEFIHHRMPSDPLFDFSVRQDGTYIAFSNRRGVYVSEQELIVLYGTERAKEIFDKGAHLQQEEIAVAVEALFGR